MTDSIVASVPRSSTQLRTDVCSSVSQCRVSLQRLLATLYQMPPHAPHKRVSRKQAAEHVGGGRVLCTCSMQA